MKDGFFLIFLRGKVGKKVANEERNGGDEERNRGG